MKNLTFEVEYARKLWDAIFIHGTVGKTNKMTFEYIFCINKSRESHIKRRNTYLINSNTYIWRMFDRT